MPSNDTTTGPQQHVGSTAELGVRPPPMPKPAGRVRHFVAWWYSRKTVHGFEEIIPYYTRDQILARDKQWLSILEAHNTTAETRQTAQKDIP